MVYTTSNLVVEDVDILGKAPSTVVAPNFTTSLESAIYIGSLMEEAYTNFMTNIGIHELSIYESTGSEIVYEAEDGQETAEKTAFKDKVGEFFKGIWDKIKHLFEEAIEWFYSNMKQARQNKMDKLIVAWNAKSSSIKDDKTFGKARLLNSDYLRNINGKGGVGFANILDSYIDNAQKVAGKIASGEETDVAAAYKSAIPAMSNSKVNIDQAKDIKSFFKGYFMIPDEAKPVNKSWINSNLNLLKQIVVDGVDARQIKKNYQNLKKIVNNMAKDVKSGKTDDAKTKAKSMVKVLSFVSAIVGAVIDTMRARYNEARNIMTAVGVALKLTSKPKEEKKAGETPAVAEEKVGESAIISTIEAAFDW